MTIIPTIAVQEFYDELNLLMQSQPDEWQAVAIDQKVLWVSSSDFDYYLQIRQQFAWPTEIGLDEDELPVLLFRGIRVKPLPVPCSM